MLVKSVMVQMIKMIDTWLSNDEKWVFISNLNETIYYALIYKTFEGENFHCFCDFYSTVSVYTE